MTHRWRWIVPSVDGGAAGNAGTQIFRASSVSGADLLTREAIQNARDVYTRRLEGVSIWVVESKHVHASNPDDSAAFYEPANDKIYRHPTFYTVPDSIKHM